MILINLTENKFEAWDNTQISISEKRFADGIINMPKAFTTGGINDCLVKLLFAIKKTIPKNVKYAIYLSEDLADNKNIIEFFTLQNIPLFKVKVEKEYLDFERIPEYSKEIDKGNPLNWYKRPLLFIKYLIFNNIIQFVFVLFIIIVAIIFWNLAISEPIIAEASKNAMPNLVSEKWYMAILNPKVFFHWDFFEPIVGISTLLIAIFVWINEQKENWILQLEKKLNVKFVFRNKIVAEVFNASLAHEGDIRNWAQTIGRETLFGNPKGNLDMDLRFEINAKLEPRLTSNKNLFKPFEITIYLRESGEIVKNEFDQGVDDSLPKRIKQLYPNDLCLHHDVLNNQSKFLPLKFYKK